MDEPNILNIPAYQRKRSISAKARKKPNFFQIKQAVKRTKKNKKSTHVVKEIPIQTTLPSQEIFSDPFLDEPLPKKQSDLKEMKTCGICEGYFDKIEVAIIKLTAPLRVGDKIIFEKQEGLFEQEIKSMQINHKEISLAVTGSEIGLKVYQKPTVGGAIYKIIA